jgi:DNA polymerase I-like protein with 3'-5' exonuclease and polymerase domains
LTTTTSRKTNRARCVDDVVKVIRTASSGLAGFDLETTSRDPRNGKIRLAQVCVGGRTMVIDLFEVADARPVFEALADLDVVLAHNGAFEYGWVYAKYGISLENLRDTMLLAQLAARGDMSVEAGLGPVVERELGINLDKEMQTSDWSSPKLSERQLEYAALDAYVLPELNATLTPKVYKSRQDEVADIENAAVAAVARMRLEGMPFDKDGWVAHAHKVEAERDALAVAMLDAEWMPQRDPVPQQWQLQGEDCLTMLKTAGLDVEGSDAKALKDVAEESLVAALFEYRKIRGDKEAKEAARKPVLSIAPTKPPAPPAPWNFRSTHQVGEISKKILGFFPKDTAEATMLRYVDKHPFFRELLKHRKLSTLVSKYGENWTGGAYDEISGRLYPGWRQIGTETGRFSCSAPNVQQVPRDGPYRSFFRARRGRTLIAADFSQIEVRIYAKLVGEKGLLDVFDAGGDVYVATAAKLMDKPESEVTKAERQKAKALVLGILYGLTHYGLPEYAFKSYNVIISPDEAEDLIAAFFEIYPAIAEDHEKVTKHVKRRGHANRKTVLGRRRDHITAEREATNYPIQGSAADGLKWALGSVYRRLAPWHETAFIVGAFHDEILVECDEGDAERLAEIITETMVSSMVAMLDDGGRQVPVKVDVAIGPVWTKE